MQKPRTKPRVIDLFAGCGGLSLGFKEAGFEIVGFVEMWEPAITTYLKNHPNTKHLGEDISKIKDETFLEYEDDVDVIVGGPPCQGFSVCGKRDPHDERNQLYNEFLRVIKIVKPRVVLMENVVGLISMKDTDNTQIINKIVNKLINLDYFVSYKVLDSSDYGVAQNRERLVVIARKLDLYPHPTDSKISVCEALKNLPLKEGSINGHLFFSPGKNTLRRIEKLKEGERISSYRLSPQRLFADKPSRTIVTKPIYIHPKFNRFLSPRELARLQSFPDSFEFCGLKTAMVKQIGNAVPPMLAKSIALKIKEDLKSVN